MVFCFFNSHWATERHIYLVLREPLNGILSMSYLNNPLVIIMQVGFSANFHIMILPVRTENKY